MVESLLLLFMVAFANSLPAIANINGLLGQSQNNILNYLGATPKNVQNTLSRKAVTLQDSTPSSLLVDVISFVPTDEIGAEHKIPDAVLSVPARIESNGYKCETHTVISKGYVLNLHRIPHSKTSKVIPKNTILLQHGIFGSAGDWLVNGPEKALPYVLADAGYDVWMSNIRGNKYSREHTKWRTNTKSFWNFSWHDVALYDIPAIIDFIKDFKGNDTKITYIGHSMGTTMLFAMLTLRPEYNQILTAGYALAPVVFMTNFKSPIKSAAPLANGESLAEMMIGIYEFLPKQSLIGKMATTCVYDAIDIPVCKKNIFRWSGANEKQYNKTLLPVYMSGVVSGTSWKQVVHFAQLIMQGFKERFKQFDYGPLNNPRMYGTSTPPEYDLSRVTLPIKLFWSRNDLLSSEEDVEKLRRRLPATTESYLVPDPKFSHLDYLWAIDAPTLLNSEILSSLLRSFK